MTSTRGPRPDVSALDPRTQRFWALQDFARGRGLEIGPLNRPLVTRDQADVQYVDVYSTDHLRNRYADDPTVDVGGIPDLDYSLIEGDQVRSLAEAAAPGAPFDWVVASHVVEHVPDLVTWLKEVAELTADNGTLVLCVPDRRYTFDLHRAPTTVGQILHAHELQADRPTTRAIFDHFRSHRDVDTGALWAGAPPPDFAGRTFELEQVLGAVREGRAGGYVDVHVWMFTPELFLEQMIELRRLALSNWYVEELQSTRRNELEFNVMLRRIPRGSDVRDEPDRELQPALSAPDWLLEAHDALARVRDLERSTQVLRGRVRRLRRRVKRQRRTLDQMAGSWRWRVGGWATWPARIVRRR